MIASERLDRIRIAFDDPRLVSNAGLLLPLTLAHHLGLGELVDSYLDLGEAPGRANAGDKMMTLVASALAGGDCIDDADALRCGGTGQVLGCTVKAPSTLGTFLRSFRWGHVRQLDRVSRELLAGAWAAGAGPGDSPLTIDLDSTVCETYGLDKEGARRHNYSGQRGYHPLLAIAAGTGDVLMARLRQGRENTARGAAHFLRETVSRVRYAGATGALTVRADSGFYTYDIVAVCRSSMCASLSASDSTGDCATSLRQYPKATGHRYHTGWRVQQTWPRPRMSPSGDDRTQGQAHARLPAGAVRQLQLSRLHHRPPGRHPRTGGRPSQTRRDRERHPRPQVRRGTEPSSLGALRRQRRLDGRPSAGT